MAEKGFGAKEINLIGSSGTPTIESPGNLNLNANNVAISTNVSIGGTLTVTGNVSVGGTLTYEDVTNIDSVGLITARSGVVTPNVDVDDFISVGSNIHLGNAGIVTATTFSGSATAVRVIAANSVAATVYPTFAGSGATQAGDLNIKTDNSLTYNSLSGELTAVKFTGDGSSLTGIAVTEAPVVDYTITGDSGSNYFFHGGGVDGTDGNPDLYLIRGQKYRFNNTTGNTHPFRFTSTGNSNAAYDKGVTGSETGIQFWTIPYDAPAKLFYVCTVHGGMVGNIYIRGAGGQNDNVGVTTFSGAVNVTAAITADDFRTDSSSSTLYLTSANDWRFRTTSGSERLRITSSGYVHFGNTGHGTNKVGGQNVTGQDYDPYLKILANTANHWLMQARSDVTSGNGIFLRSGNSSSTYTLYATGYDENNPHLVVRGDGRVGIKESSPVNILTITNTGSQDDALGNVQVRYTGGNGTVNSSMTVKNYKGTSQFMQWEASGLRMGNRIVTNSGNGHVYITAGSDTVRLSINASTGNFTGSSSADISDGRLKENIASISNATATIKQLLGKTFTWKEEAKLGTDTKYGFIAQELKTVLPDLVYQDVGINRVSKDADKQGYGQGEIVDDYSDDYKDDSKSEWSMAVNTSGVIPILVEAFKELEARIAALEG